MTTYTLQIDVVGKDKASKPLGAVKGALGGFKSVMGGILGAQMLTGIASGIKNMAKEAIQATGDYERLSDSLNTLVAKELKNTGVAENMADALELSGDKAKSLLAWTEQLAITSPFDQAGVGVAFQTAMAYGFTADEAQRLTEATIDYAAGAGKQTAAMNQISLALGQIKAKGKLAGQEVLQLVNAGIAVDQILAEAMGKSTAEIVKMRESGLIPANDAIEMIVASLEGDFAGAAQRQSESWAGLTNTFEDLKQIGLREMFAGILTEIKPMALEFSEWMQGDGIVRIRQMSKNIGSMTKNLMTAAKGAKQFFGQLKGAGTNVLEKIFGKIDGGELIESLGRSFENIQSFISSSNIGETMTQMFAGAMENISNLASQVIPFFVSQIEKISAWVSENQPLIDVFFENLVAGWLVVQGAVFSFWSVVEPIFSGLMSIVLNLGTLMMQFATGDWAGAWQTINDILLIATESITVSLMALFEWVAGLFDSSLAELGAVWKSNWEAMKLMLLLVLENMIAFFIEKTSFIRGIMFDFMAILSAAWKGDWEKVGQILAETWEKIKTAIKDGTAEISKIIKEKSSAWVKSLEEKAESYRSATLVYMQKAAKGLKDGVNMVIDAMAEVGAILQAAWAQAIAGLGSISLSANIDANVNMSQGSSGGGGAGGGGHESGQGGQGGFASGGISRGPSSGYTALLHGDEAVIPLAGGRSVPVSLNGGGGGTPMTFNIYEADDAQETARKIVSELKLQGVIQ